MAMVLGAVRERGKSRKGRVREAEVAGVPGGNACFGERIREGREGHRRWRAYLAVVLGGVDADLLEVGLQRIHEALALKIPDLDGALGGGAQPVAVGREAQRVDDVTGVQAAQNSDTGGTCMSVRHWGSCACSGSLAGSLA